MLLENRKSLMLPSQNQLRIFLGSLALFCAQFALAAPPDTTVVHYYLRDTFCSNQGLFIGNQFFNKSNTSSVRTAARAAANGADSLIHVDLAVSANCRGWVLAQNLCVGDTLWINGKAIMPFSFLGEETIEGGAANGCDSIIEVNLHVVEPPTYALTDTLCPGDSGWSMAYATTATTPLAPNCCPMRPPMVATRW